jgi:hypothetical protein
MRSRAPSAGVTRSMMHRGMAWRRARPPSPQLLRYGIEFADGRKATNVGGMFGGSMAAMAAGDEPAPDPAEDIRLVPGGGHRGGRHSRQELWVWPLPPPGPGSFVCEWPRYGIPESRIEVDAALIRESARRAEEIWPTSV